MTAGASSGESAGRHTDGGDAIALEAHTEGCVLPLRVQPGARRDGIVGRHGAALKVAVTAAPEKGKANEAVLKVLQKQLGIKRSALEILGGHTSRNKRVLVRGVDAAALCARLASSLSVV